MTHRATDPTTHVVAARSTYAAYLPTGTLVVCTQGALIVELPAIALPEHAHRPRMRLSAGETCQLEQAGWVCCATHDQPATVRVIAPASAASVLAQVLANVARRARLRWQARRAAAHGQGMGEPRDLSGA